MPNLVALRLMVSDKKIFKDFIFFKFRCHGNQSFRQNQILLRNSGDGRTDGRTHDGHLVMTLAIGAKTCLYIINKYNPLIIFGL